MPTSVTGEFGIDKVTGANVVPYDNTDSGLTATDVQDAIDESLIQTATKINIAGQSSVDISGIPSGVKRVKITFIDVSTSAATSPYFQLRANSSYITSGYVGNAMNISNSGVVSSSLTGAILINGGSASNLYVGSLELNYIDGLIWEFECEFSERVNNFMGRTNGYRQLPDALDGLRLTLDTGNFDGGVIAMSWEL